VRTKSIGIAIIGLIFASAALSAEINVKTYRAAKARGGRDWEFITTYFMGQGTALGWANAELARKHQPLFFCETPNLGLNSENFISIIDAAITRWKLADDDLVDVYFLPALEFTFPCK
jgi:hypothetical protein